MRSRITRFVVFSLIIATGLLEAMGCTPSRQSSQVASKIHRTTP